VTFSDGGRAGSYANFGAASCQSLTLADHADFGAMSQLTIALWFKQDCNSGGNEGLIGKFDQGAGADSFLIYISDSVNQVIMMTNTGSNVSSTTLTTAIALDTWYYVVMTWDGTTQKGYLNGHLVDSDAQSGTITDSSEPLAIAAFTTGSTPGSFFDGQIAGVSITRTAMTEREVEAEYDRGVRRINSTIDTNDTISDNDVAAIAADPAGKYVTVMGDDKVVYIFDEFGVPVASDTYPGTTARDPAIKSMLNGPDPHYVMAGSDQIEIVQPNTKIGA